MKKSISNSMDDYLASIGLWRKPIAQDGSSLFRAVAEQMLNTQSLHMKIRECCISYITRNKDRFQHLINEPIDRHLDKLSDPRQSGGLLEIHALAYLYRRDFIVYSDIGKLPANITEQNHKKKILLCFSNGHHYDTIYPRSYTVGAAICQSIVYEVLYNAVFGIDQAYDMANKLFDRPRNGEVIDGVTRLSINSNTGAPSKLPFPYSQVAKALQPDKYRNVEFDTWKDAKKENHYQRQFNPVKERFFPGDKCQVKKEGCVYNAHIQNMSSDKGPVTVFIEELGERCDVPYLDLVHIPRTYTSEKNERKLQKRKELSLRIHAPITNADGAAITKARPMLGFRGGHMGQPRQLINAAGHPVRKFHYQENYRGGRFPTPAPARCQTYHTIRSRGRLSSEGSPHDVPVTSAIENVDGMAFHNRGRLSSDGSPQAAPVNSVPENVELTQQTNVQEMNPAAMSQTQAVAASPDVSPIQVLPPGYHPAQIMYPCMTPPPMEHFVPGELANPEDMRYLFNLGLHVYLNSVNQCQQPQFFPYNYPVQSMPPLPPQPLDNSMDEEMAAHSNGQSHVVKNSNKKVITNNVVKKNIVQLSENNTYDLDKKLGDLKLHDHKDQNMKGKSLALRYSCDRSDAGSDGNGKRSVSSHDSGFGESDLSSNEGIDVDSTFVLGDESLDSLDLHSDDNYSQHSISSSELYIKAQNTGGNNSPHEGDDTKGEITACSPQPIKPMRPIPYRFRRLLDEEARENPALYPKRFEGQPLIRHKPLGNRKRKLARLAHIAYMMEMGSGEKPYMANFEFNPDAESFEPHFDGSYTTNYVQMENYYQQCIKYEETVIVQNNLFIEQQQQQLQQKPAVTTIINNVDSVSPSADVQDLKVSGQQQTGENVVKSDIVRTNNSGSHTQIETVPGSNKDIINNNDHVSSEEGVVNVEHNLITKNINKGNRCDDKVNNIDHNKSEIPPQVVKDDVLLETQINNDSNSEQQYSSSSSASVNTSNNTVYYISNPPTHPHTSSTQFGNVNVIHNCNNNVMQANYHNHQQGQQPTISSEFLHPLPPHMFSIPPPMISNPGTLISHDPNTGYEGPVHVIPVFNNTYNPVYSSPSGCPPGSLPQTPVTPVTFVPFPPPQVSQPQMGPVQPQMVPQPCNPMQHLPPPQPQSQHQPQMLPPQPTLVPTHAPQQATVVVSSQPAQPGLPPPPPMPPGPPMGTVYFNTVYQPYPAGPHHMQQPPCVAPPPQYC